MHSQLQEVDQVEKKWPIQTNTHILFGGGADDGAHNSWKEGGGERDDAQTRASVIRLKDDTGRTT